MPLACPACFTAHLEPWTDPATRLEIDCCPQCRGFWFDGEELSRLFPSASLLERVFEHERTAVPRDSGGERRCPRCQTRLKLTQALEVEIDVCRRCRGIWLDAGELMQLVRRYPDMRGGDLMVLNQVASGLANSETRGAALESLLRLLGAP